MLLGNKQAGKSTTAAALLQHGATLLSDDLAALLPHEQGFRVPPGYQHVRLWPAALQTLFGGAREYPQVYSDNEKRYLKLDGNNNTHGQFCADTMPLAAIYVLGQRLPAASAPMITPLTAQEKLLELIAHTYGDAVVNEQLRTHEFKVLSRLAAAVPIRRLERPDNLTALSALSQAIRADFQSLSDGSTPTETHGVVPCFTSYGNINREN